MDALSRRQTLLSIGAIALAGCVSDSPDETSDENRESSDSAGIDHEIAIHDDRFGPARLAIELGDRVVWHNTGASVATVTASGDSLPPDAEYFASGGSGSETVARLLYPFVGGVHGGDTYTHTPTVPGEYEYYSISQQARGYGMAGTLVVE